MTFRKACRKGVFYGSLARGVEAAFGKIDDG
jgi:hypothetical protein